jgi:hypothetical protein
MITLFSSMCQGENHYTRTSVDKIRENLKKYHKIHVKRRWIFYCLAELLERKLLTRKSRYRNDDTGLISQIPSLLAFTVQGMKYLVSKRVTGAWKLLKSMIKFATGGDQRWPKKKDTAPAGELDRFVPSKDDWNNLLGGLTKKIE